MDFYNLCKTEKLENVVDIYIKQKNIINIDLNHAFMIACENNNLPIAKWLRCLDIEHDTLGITFHKICDNNHFSVLKWLHSVGVKDFDVNIEFEKSCINGNIEMIKFLFELGVGYHIIKLCITKLINTINNNKKYDDVLLFLQSI